MENPAFAKKIENKCVSDVWKYKLLYYIVVSECVCVCVCFVFVEDFLLGVFWILRICGVS